MQDPSFWFYTLSTDPQVLAAMFALIIAVFVFRTDSLEKVINRDVDDSKRFLLPIFGNLEIHEIEAMTGKQYLKKLKIATEDILKEDEDFLGLEEGRYEDLRNLYSTKIKEYERHYSSDKKRIYEYLLVKMYSIRTHVLSKKVINQCFVGLTLLTSLTIFISLFYLPKPSLCSICIFKNIHVLVLINVCVVTLGVLVMTFTKSFLKLFDSRII